MRLPPAISTYTEEVLREILRFTAPADSTLSRYFRDHPRIGARERGAIAEGIYGLLRNKSVYTSFSESGSGAPMRRLALLGLADGVGVDAVGETGVRVRDIDQRQAISDVASDVGGTGGGARLHGQPAPGWSIAPSGA